MEGLTELQGRFVEEYVRAGCRNARKAALVAGYSQETADNAGRDILGSIPVRTAIDEAAEALRRSFVHRLTVEAGPLAVGALVDILTDPDSSSTARLAAARDVLDRIGTLAGGERLDTPTPQLIWVRYADEEYSKDPLGRHGKDL